MISFRNASYAYQPDRPPAVKNLTFNLPAGSFHFLTGPSGAGKTTVFRMLYADLLPTEGEVAILGQTINNLSPDAIAHVRRHLGIVFQDFRLLPHLTVRENVELPLALAGETDPTHLAAVDDMLDWVGLAAKRHETPDRLSGGEKQRVAIARAVVNRPKILIADEPTGNVDDAMARRIMHLFVELNKHGTTVLVATHDSHLIKTFGFPVLHMKDGELTKPKREVEA